MNEYQVDNLFRPHQRSLEGIVKEKTPADSKILRICLIDTNRYDSPGLCKDI